MNAAHATKPARSNDVASLLRGIEVLDALARSPQGTSPQELVEETGLDRSTLQRLLRTLVSAGYADRLERGRYAVATAGLSLGVKLSQSSHLARVSRPYLVELQRSVGETVNLAVLTGTDVTYVARLATQRILSINIDVGTRLPAYCTSLGRAILAALPEDQARTILQRSELTRLTERTIVDSEAIMKRLERVRTQGFALTEAELEPGLCSVAAPVIGPGATVVGAVNISVPLARVTSALLKREMAPKLTDATRRMSAALGGGPPR
jgi:IclR family pca regulon transcriptional regulator